MVHKKDPGNCENFVLLPGSVVPCISDTVVSLLGGTWGTLTPFSVKSHEKTVHKKDPGNDLQCAPCAPPRSLTLAKRSGTCTVRCPFLFRSIAKRHAMTGSGLGRYAETGQPPGFSGDCLSVPEELSPYTANMNITEKPKKTDNNELTLSGQKKIKS